MQNRLWLLWFVLWLCFHAVIPKITKSSCGKVVHDKQHSCYFCEKLVTNIWRHYELVHHSKARVQKVLSLSKDSRMDEIDKLRLLGDYYHNIKVLSVKTGQLIVVRRPRHDCSTKDFLPCPYCFGFFHRVELWRHCLKCKFCTTNEMRDQKNCQKNAALLIAPYVYSSSGLSQQMMQVLCIMSNDDVSVVAKNDSLILTYGELLACNKPSSQFKYISMQMRMLARLLMRLRNNAEKPNADLSFFIEPSKFDDVVAAVYQEAKHETSTNSSSARLNVPSVALKLGYSMRKCSGLLVNRALREHNYVMERDAWSFIHIFDSEWQARLSSVALKTMTDDKRKKDVLPLTSDLLKIKNHLDKSIPELCTALRDECSRQNYNNLVDHLLTSIILFNKRRSGEASKMLLESYQRAPLTKSGLDDIQTTLTDMEQQLCSRLKLVNIPGKRNRTVPVLLTANAVAGIECLIEKRNEVGIDERNPFMFARCSGLNSVDGYVCLRRVVNSLKLDRPDLVTRTYLRKYIATVSQLLDMKNSEFDLLCRHMGHTATVHREFYRLPSHTLELAKMSKLLLAVERGNLNALTGKSLDEIDVNHIDYASESESDTPPSDESDDACEDTNDERHDVNNQREDANSVAKKRKRPPRSARNTVAADDLDADVLPVPGSVSQPVVLKKNDRRPWSTSEKKAVYSNLHVFIRQGRVPGKEACMKAIADSGGVLSGRSWKHVKFAIKNLQSSGRRMLDQ